MSFDARRLAIETVLGGGAVCLDSTLPGLGVGALALFKQWQAARRKDADFAGCRLEAFMDSMSRHLEALCRDHPEYRALDENAASIVLTAAITVLRDFAFDARAYQLDDGEDPARAARRLVRTKADRSGLPEEAAIVALVENVVEAWFRAMTEFPLERSAIESAFRTLLRERTEHLDAELTALRDAFFGTPILRSNREVLPAGTLAPSLLLDPAFAVVPFQGRETEMAELMAWCDDEPGPAVAVRLVVGPGGRGKTRLLTELAERLRERLDGQVQWRAGLLDLAETSLTPERLAQELRLQERVLIGIDRAEVRVGEVQAVLRAAWRQQEGRRVRVVLVARNAGEWWQRLTAQDCDAARVLQATPPAPVLKLLPFEQDRISRADYFEQARGAFRDVLPTSALPPSDLAPSVFDDELFADPLLLHMAALKSALGHEIEVTETALFEAVLESERRYWSVELARVGQSAALGETEAAATVLTLLQGVFDRTALKRIVSQVLTLAGRDLTVTADALTDALCTLYGRGDSSEVQPIGPDRLGEFLVAQNMRPTFEHPYPKLIDVALQVAAEPNRREANRTAVLTVLARLAGWRIEGRWLLKVLLDRRLDELIEPVITVAQETGDPIGKIAAVSLEAAEDAVVAELVVDRFPAQSVALRELAEVASRLATRDELPESSSETQRAERARRLNTHSNRLAGLGRRDEALAAIEETVSMYRVLDRTNPDDFRRPLAMSLINLSNRLAEFGRPEMAVAALTKIKEAVSMCRALEKANPNDFRLELGLSIDTLSNRLAELDRPKAAVAAIKEAVSIRRALAEARRTPLCPNLAASLNNLSTQLAKLGRRHRKAALEAIEEAVLIRRALAEARPDAFRPNLAASLNNLALRLSDFGRPEQAVVAIEEAVPVYRALAEVRPDVFRSDLATSLFNLALRLSDLGRPEPALAAIEEAVPMYRTLAAERPLIYGPQLGRAKALLKQLAADHGQLGFSRESCEQ